MVQLKAASGASRWINCTHFNSNMVQLKVENTHELIKIDGDFNSNMVQLKAYSFIKTSISFGNFNSNMVQLKASKFR